MKAKEIVEISLKNIKREDILLTSLIATGGTSYTDEQKEVFDDILASLNDSIMAISYIYLPQKMKEDIVVENNKYNYSSLSKTLIDVVRIKDKCGVLHKFFTYPTYLKCDNGEFEITYTYQPDIIENLNDDIQLENKNVSSRILMIGTVANFYLKRGLFDESLLWEKSFKEQIALCKRKKYVPQMKSWK